HLPGDALPPASAVLDPRRPDCPSEDKDLCGSGVAFKLAQALVTTLGLSPNLPLHFLDYVALATVADVVPLTGENRILVRHGLETLNARRQELDQKILDEAIDLADKTLRPDDRALVLAADEWHPGVIGIVASRLVERYGRPTFMIAWDGEVGRGSGRSIAGFDLHDALHRVGHLLEKYGGHTMAAGLTIRRERFDEFRVAFLQVAGDLLAPSDLVPAQRVDLELPLRLVSDEL